MLYVQRVPEYYSSQPGFYPFQHFQHSGRMNIHGYGPHDELPFMPSSEEQRLRQIAEEHHRRAELAAALAQREHERARQRQATLNQLRQQAAMASRRRSFYAPSAPSRRASMFEPFGNDFFGEEAAHDALIARQAQRERELAVIRRQSELEQQQRQARAFSRFREEHAKQEVDESGSALTQLLTQLFGDDEPEEPVEQPVKKVHFGQTQAQKAPAIPRPVESKGKGKAKAMDEPEPSKVQPEQPQRDFISDLWNLMNGGYRSDVEQDAILRQLGILAPQPQQSRQTSVPVAGPSHSRHVPAASAPADSVFTQSTASNVPLPKPVPTQPVTPSSPAPSSPASTHSASFSSIDAVEAKFNDIKASFTFPNHVDFDTSSPSLKLLYTPNNAPIHQYESELLKLLTRLDEVESDGSESIRGARKALVKAVEGELDRLDGLKSEAWEKVKVDEPVAESVVVEAPEAAVSREEVTSDDVQVAAVSVPIEEAVEEAVEVTTNGDAVAEETVEERDDTTPSHSTSDAEEPAVVVEVQTDATPDVPVSELPAPSDEVPSVEVAHPDKVHRETPPTPSEEELSLTSSPVTATSPVLVDAEADTAEPATPDVETVTAEPSSTADPADAEVAEEPSSPRTNEAFVDVASDLGSDVSVDTHSDSEPESDHGFAML
ncbi:hypothetical protein FRB99_002357 [Tulasnella sp. 403]|nr:hypothetical protein FRB99_002357 [Tulasnella sp. 403]